MNHANFAKNGTDNNDYSRKLIRAKVTATMGVNSPTALVNLYGKNFGRLELVRLLESQSKFKIAWYSIFLTFAFVFLCFVPQSYLKIIDLLILLVNIDLVSRGKVVGVYIGIAECVVYSIISYGAGLYGEILKMLAISVPINIFTIISWTKNSRTIKQKKTKDDADIEIKKLDSKGWCLTLFLTIVASGLSYVLLRFVLKQEVSLVLGSITLGATIVYKVLNGARYMDSWLFGILQTSISLLMWVSIIFSGAGTIADIPMIAIYLSVISNDIYGYCLWKLLYRKVAVNGTAVILNRRPIKINKVIKLRRRFRKLKWNQAKEQRHLESLHK